MSLYIVEGKIGGGKTYFCMHHMIKRYFEYDPILDEYIPKRGFCIVSNIDKLRLDHVDLKTDVTEKGLLSVFHRDYVDDLRVRFRASNVVFIIDEAAHYFNSKFFNEDVFHFFEFHRHLGLDVYLIVQNIHSMPLRLTALAEKIIHSVSRTYNTPGTFRYKEIDQNETLRSFIIRRDKKIFALYQSFEFEESEKIRPIYYRYGLYIGVGILLIVFLFKFMILDRYFRSGREATASVEKVVKRPQGTLTKMVPGRFNFKELHTSIENSNPVDRSVVEEKLDKLKVGSSSVEKALTGFGPVKDCRLVTEAVDNGTGDIVRSLDCGDRKVKTVNNVVVFERINHGGPGRRLPATGPGEPLITVKMP